MWREQTTPSEVTTRDTGVVRDRVSGTEVTTAIILIGPTLSFMPARPSSIISPWLTVTRALQKWSTWVQGDDGSTSTMHVTRPRRVASMCLVYVQFVSLCGSSAHARSSPRCAMASVETSTTVLSGAVPAASGRGRRRTVGLTGQLSIVCIHTMYTGARNRSPAALGGVRTVSQMDRGRGRKGF